MYPFFRYSKAIAQAVIANQQGKILGLDDTGEIVIRCGISDIDNFLEMNNGRVMTLYDFGRTDFAIRAGLGKTLIKNRWGFVVAGSTVQYRKRIRAFDKVTIKTHIEAMDERWVYMEQSMWVKGKPCSSALLRTGITEKGRVIATKRILEALDKTDWSKPPQGYVKEWIESDNDRPWPPAG